MGSTGEQTDVLEMMDGLPEGDFPRIFVTKIVPILEHSRDEIIELLKQKGTHVLKQLRELVFAEMVAKLPQYVGREMYARRKNDLLADDIYVLAFSATNAIPDKRLSKCLKPTLDLDATQMSVADEDTSESHDIQTLVEICVQLQEKVKNLEATVQSQQERLIALEALSTNAQIEHLDNMQRNVVPTEGSTDQAEGVVVGQPEAATPGTQPTAPQPGDDLQQHFDTYSAAVSQPRANDGARMQDNVPGPQGAPSTPADEPNQATADEGFRHSAKERKNIRRGGTGLHAAVNRRDIHGTSTGQHRVSAAGQSGPSTYLVYAGKLAANTTCDDLRCHLNDVGIQDIADVMNLNGRNRARESSFCISINSKSSMEKAFCPELWPTGVIVREFRPSKGSNKRQTKSTVQYSRSNNGQRQGGQDTQRRQFQTDARGQLDGWGDYDQQWGRYDRFDVPSHRRFYDRYGYY